MDAKRDEVIRVYLVAFGEFKQVGYTTPVYVPSLTYNGLLTTLFEHRLALPYDSWNEVIDALAEALQSTKLKTKYWKLTESKSSRERYREVAKKLVECGSDAVWCYVINKLQSRGGLHIEVLTPDVFSANFKPIDCSDEIDETVHMRYFVKRVPVDYVGECIRHQQELPFDFNRGLKRIAYVRKRFAPFVFDFDDNGDCVIRTYDYAYPFVWLKYETVFAICDDEGYEAYAFDDLYLALKVLWRAIVVPMPQHCGYFAILPAKYRDDWFEALWKGLYALLAKDPRATWNYALAIARIGVVCEGLMDVKEWWMSYWW